MSWYDILMNILNITVIGVACESYMNLNYLQGGRREDYVRSHIRQRLLLPHVSQDTSYSKSVPFFKTYWYVKVYIAFPHACVSHSSPEEFIIYFRTCSYTIRKRWKLMKGTLHGCRTKCARFKTFSTHGRWWLFMITCVVFIVYSVLYDEEDWIAKLSDILVWSSPSKYPDKIENAAVKM